MYNVFLPFIHFVRIEGLMNKKANLVLTSSFSMLWYIVVRLLSSHHIYIVISLHKKDSDASLLFGFIHEYYYTEYRHDWNEEREKRKEKNNKKNNKKIKIKIKIKMQKDVVPSNWRNSVCWIGRSSRESNSDC